MTNDNNSHGAEWEALIEADPARENYVDLANIRSKVITDTPAVTNVIPLTRRAWFKPAAAAAGVALLLGTGSGYTIAAMNESPSMPAVYTDARVDSNAASGELGGVVTPGMADTKNTQAAGGAPTSKVGGYSSAIWPGYGGRPFLEPTSQLTDDASKAVGYVLDDSGVKRKAAIKDVADAFGITGKVSGNVKDGLFIGDETWAGPVVQFNGSTYDQQASWNFSDQTHAPQMCGATKGDDFVGMSNDCDKPNGVAPTAEQAIAHAQEIFAKLGLAQGDANWSSYDTSVMWGVRNQSTSPFITVIADVLVDGKVSGLQWQMVVGPDLSVSSASGFLATFKATASYDLVGAKTAVLRSQDARWINLAPQEQYKNGGYPMPLAYGKDLVMSGDVAMPMPSTPPQPVDANGLPILDAGLDKESITSATAAYLQWSLVDGSTILLPAYKLVADQGTSSVDDDRSWLQIAIADKYVDFN